MYKKTYLICKFVYRCVSKTFYNNKKLNPAKMKTKFKIFILHLRNSSKLLFDSF